MSNTLAIYNNQNHGPALNRLVSENFTSLNNKKNITKSVMPLLDQKTFNDYLAFFTTAQADMVGYTYLESSDFFNNLVRYSKDYYPFNDDVMSISQYEPQLRKYLAEISDIIEIGPGCDYSLEHKTLKLLSYAKNLKRYYAVDNFKTFLDSACSFIANNTSNIEVSAIEYDVMSQLNLKLDFIENSKKCFLFLGSTLGQFDKIQQNYCLKQISNLTSPNDLFILTVDTNQDEESLLRAYSNKYSSALIMGVLNYFVRINNDFAKHLSSFELKCKWNKLSSMVDMYFMAKKDLSFELKKDLKICIKKGQEFRGIKAYKYTSQEIADRLNNNDFEILEIFNRSNKMQIFVCRRREKCSL